MNKAVMISIKPKHCLPIMAASMKTMPIYEQSKIYELRKSKPKIPVPFKAYIYCTQDGWLTSNQEHSMAFMATNNRVGRFLNKNRNCIKYSGTVFAEFVCDSIIEWGEDDPPPVKLDEIKLTYPQIREYAPDKTLYLWHISNLVIYDEPKSITDFCAECNEDCIACNCEHWKYTRVNADEFDFDCETGNKKFLKRPPQSWCYVYV